MNGPLGTAVLGKTEAFENDFFNRHIPLWELRKKHWGRTKQNEHAEEGNKKRNPGQQCS
jgi:hypothetical protein